MGNYHKELKPNTPWQIRRKIRSLENSVHRLTAWRYRLITSMELIIIAMLLICAIHYKITFT